jgi:osmotically inducible protein OsmC
MAIRTGQAVWNGDLKSGKGTVKLGSGAFEGAYSFSSRFEEGAGTNPEELIGAAHAGCFSMAFSGALAAAGFTPKRISTTAKVHLTLVEKGFKITLIELVTDAEVPGIDNRQFQELAENSKKTCPVSQALAAIEIKLEAKLVSA